MKRRRIRWITGMLLFGMLFGCTQTTIAPQTEATPAPTAEPTAAPIDPIALIDEAEITESSHPREADYSSVFKTYRLDTPILEAHLENNAAYSDEALKGFAKALAEDLAAVERCVGKTPEKVTVYITERMLKSRPVQIGNRVFCTVSDMESGAYREALCGAGLGISTLWKQVGLSTVIFGTPDDSGLNAYYADEAHALTASCAAVYFLPELADEKTVEAARETAAALTAFALETEGFDAFKSIASTSELLPAWSARRGIRTPVLPNGHEHADRMTAENGQRYLCVVQTENLTINVYRDNFIAHTADELYAFVAKLYYGMDIVFEQIEAEIPAYAARAKQRFQDGFEINLYNPTSGRGSFAGPQTVFLYVETHIWHEIVHVILKEDVQDVALWWQCEAIADHFSKRAKSIAAPLTEETDLDVVFTDSYGVSPEEASRDYAFWKRVWPIYLAESAADPTVPEGTRSDRAWERMIGIGELLTDDNPLTWGDDPSVAGARGRDAGNAQTDGNALSYSEATVLLEYLFDAYGAQTVVTGYMNGRPLSETCGKDYPELYADCIAYLKETYGALLNEN